MRKTPLFLILALLTLIVLTVLLSFQAREVPVRTIETEVRPGGDAQ